jgi:hypothetical protein
LPRAVPFAGDAVNPMVGLPLGSPRCM